MSKRGWIGSTVGMCLGLLVGFAIAGVGAERHPANERLSTVGEHPVQVSPGDQWAPDAPNGKRHGSPRPDCSHEEADLARLTEEIATVRALSRLKVAAAAGVRIDWPEKYRETYSAVRVREALDEAQAACPELASAESYVDCDEFPCLIWMEGPVSLRGCTHFRLTTGQHVSIGGYNSLGGFDLAATAIDPAEWPPPDEYDAAMRRLIHRVERDQYMVMELFSLGSL